MLPLLVVTAFSTSTTTTKKILVTGGNKGIGKAICQKLLEDYDDNVHVLLASRDVELGEKAIQDIQEQVKDCTGRIELLQIDTSCDESVTKAASTLDDNSLYGIVNNAGLGPHLDISGDIVVNTNYYGPKRVNDAFKSKLIPFGGRIVNMASAGGPNYVSTCYDEQLAAKLGFPWKLNGIAELDEIANKLGKDYTGNDAYRFSKALLGAYTWLHAKAERDNMVVINCVSPGYINTDMTAGFGATKPPSAGAIPPVWALMSEELNSVPSGRYYGSDMKRSPMHVYRDPGEPVYEGPDDDEDLKVMSLIEIKEAMV